MEMVRKDAAMRRYRQSTFLRSHGRACTDIPHPLLVVLDIDETLVHASCEGPALVLPQASCRSAMGRDAAAPFELIYRSLRTRRLRATWLYPRPGVARFLAWLAASPHEVVFYTAASQAYAEAVLGHLLRLARVQPRFRLLHRTHTQCLLQPGARRMYTKPLRRLAPCGLGRVVTIDNAPVSMWHNPRNGLLIPPWQISTMHGVDDHLTRMRKVLARLGQQSGDVRPLLASVPQAMAARQAVAYLQKSLPACAA